jgi:hypothetical protein
MWLILPIDLRPDAPHPNQKWHTDAPPSSKKCDVCVASKINSQGVVLSADNASGEVRRSDCSTSGAKDPLDWIMHDEN